MNSVNAYLKRNLSTRFPNLSQIQKQMRNEIYDDRLTVWGKKSSKTAVFQGSHPRAINLNPGLSKNKKLGVVLFVGDAGDGSGDKTWEAIGP